jgi:hypothetical protein
MKQITKKIKKYLSNDEKTNNTNDTNVCNERMKSE